MTVDINQVVKLTEELKLAQERVRQLQVELAQAVLGHEIKTMTPPPPSFGERSMPERIVYLLEMSPAIAFSFDEVYRNINADNEPYIRSLLSRLVKEGRIESRGWGKYGAVSEKEKPKAS